MSGIALLYADDGYSKRANCYGLHPFRTRFKFIRQTAPIPMVQEVSSLRGIGQGRCRLQRVESCKIVFLCVLSDFFTHFCCRMHRLDTMHCITDGWTDGQTDGDMMPIANRTLYWTKVQSTDIHHWYWIFRWNIKSTISLLNTTHVLSLCHMN